MAYNSKDFFPRTCLQNELRMVMVGKTGVGKSETGNTIIGKKVFDAKASFSSATRTCKEHTFQRGGQNLQLIDVPGFVDTRLTEDDIRTEVMKCVAMSHPGLHAILFIIEIGRFTDDDKNTLMRFCQSFGEKSAEYVIVIFTKLDCLKRENKTLDDSIRESPDMLQKFLKKIDHRYLAVDNWTTNTTEKDQFFFNLLEMVRRLVESNNGTYYTNEMYQQAEKTRLAKIQAEKDRLAKIEKERDEKLLAQERERLQKELDKKLNEMKQQHDETINRLEKQRREDKEEAEKALNKMKEENAEKDKEREEQANKAKETYERKAREDMEDKLDEMKRKIDEERTDRVIKRQRGDIGGSTGQEAARGAVGPQSAAAIGAAVGAAFGPVGAAVGALWGAVAGLFI